MRETWFFENKIIRVDFILNSPSKTTVCFIVNEYFPIMSLLYWLICHFIIITAIIYFDFLSLLHSQIELFPKVFGDGGYGSILVVRMKFVVQ